MGSVVAPRHVESSWVRDHTVPPALAGRFFTPKSPGRPSFRLEPPGWSCSQTEKPWGEAEMPSDVERSPGAHVGSQRRGTFESQTWSQSWDSRDHLGERGMSLWPPMGGGRRGERRASRAHPTRKEEDGEGRCPGSREQRVSGRRASSGHQPCHLPPEMEGDKQHVGP